MTNELSNKNEKWSDEFAVFAIWILFLLMENENAYGNFKNEILTENRYIPSDVIVEFYEKLKEKIDSAVCKFRKGRIMFRSRIVENDLKKDLLEDFAKKQLGAKDDYKPEGTFTEIGSFFDYFLNVKSSADEFFEMTKDLQYQGYSPENSGAPKKGMTKTGRLNAEGISYLYAALDAKTTIQEIKPYIGQFVSVAKIKTNKSLKLLDLTMDFPVEKKTFDEFKDPYEIKSILSVIADEFKKPNHGNTTDYIPTQHIADYIKEVAKLDGIVFWSSVKNGGKNIVLYDAGSCDVISSKIVRVEGIDVKIKSWK